MGAGLAPGRRCWMCLAVTCLCVLRSQADSEPWLPGAYPNPIKYPKRCGREDSVGWVCDPDHVVSKDDADSLQALVQEISAATPPYPPAYCDIQGHEGYPQDLCGSKHQNATQVAVAMLRKLGSRFGRPMDVEAAYFADSLYNAWQMEHLDCKNGLLLLCALEDQEVHIRTGVALTPVLTKQRLATVVHNMKPKLLQGDVAGAIQQGLDEAVLMLQGFAQPPMVVVRAPRRGLALFFVGTAGMLLIIIFRFWLWLGKRRKARQGIMVGSPRSALRA